MPRSSKTLTVTAIGGVHCSDGGEPIVDLISFDEGAGVVGGKCSAHWVSKTWDTEAPMHA